MTLDLWYYIYMNNRGQPMRYEVRVPSAPHEGESTDDLNRAWILCLDLSEEFGYAQVVHNGVILGDYADGHG